MGQQRRPKPTENKFFPKRCEESSEFKAPDKHASLASGQIESWKVKGKNWLPLANTGCEGKDVIEEDVATPITVGVLIAREHILRKRAGKNETIQTTAISVLRDYQAFAGRRFDDVLKNAQALASRQQ